MTWDITLGKRRVDAKIIHNGEDITNDVMSITVRANADTQSVVVELVADEVRMAVTEAEGEA